MRAVLSLSLLMAFLWSAGLATAQQSAPKADSAQMKALMARAAATADGDLKTSLGLCKAAEDIDVVRDPERARQGLIKLMANSAMEPAKVFDNLYFVGSKWVSAWALKTSAGILLIDAMDNDQEARFFIEAGLRKLGLDPAEIKQVIITHAHGDHYGGHQYLRDKFKARMVMSEDDWKELETPPLQFDVPEWGRPPKRDISVKDGDKLTLGDTTVELVETPGHTSGTLSVILPVFDHGEKHLALLWGGTAFNFGKRVDRLLMYIHSTEKAAVLVKQQHVDIMLSNHVTWDDSIPKIAALAQRKPGQPHPYVLGEPAVERFLSLAGDCAAATLAAFDGASVPADKRAK